MRHKEGDVIYTPRGKYASCVIANGKIAVFAESNKSGTKKRFTKLFAVMSRYKKNKVGDGLFFDSVGFHFALIKNGDGKDILK